MSSLCPFAIDNSMPYHKDNLADINCTETDEIIGAFDNTGCFFDGISDKCPYKNTKVIINIAE